MSEKKRKTAEGDDEGSSDRNSGKGKAKVTVEEEPPEQPQEEYQASRRPPTPGTGRFNRYEPVVRSPVTVAVGRGPRPVPVPNRRPSESVGALANGLTREQCGDILSGKCGLASQGALIYPIERRSPDGETLWICNFKPNKAEGGHPQMQIPLNREFPGEGKKVLVHHLWFRWKFGLIINPELHISHRDAENALLLIQESAALNESRKYCHAYRWYAPLPGEAAPRCPHRESPCTGP